MNRPDASIRYYGSVAGVLRLVHSRDYFGLEPIAPAALQIALGIEAKPWKAANVFFEMAPIAYFARDPDLLAASYPEGYDAFSTSVADWGLIDFLHYRLGVRIHL